MDKDVVGRRDVGEGGINVVGGRNVLGGIDVVGGRDVV